jgi:hypothetical protein
MSLLLTSPEIIVLFTSLLNSTLTTITLVYNMPWRKKDPILTITDNIKTYTKEKQ